MLSISDDEMLLSVAFHAQTQKPETLAEGGGGMGSSVVFTEGDLLLFISLGGVHTNVPIETYSTCDFSGGEVGLEPRSSCPSGLAHKFHLRLHCFHKYRFHNPLVPVYKKLILILKPINTFQ